MSDHKDPDDETDGLISISEKENSNYLQQQQIPLRATKPKQYTIDINDEIELSTNKNQYSPLIINEDYKEDENSDDNRYYGSHLSEEKTSFIDETSPLDYALNKKMNDTEIIRHKTQIIQYCEKENIVTKLNEITAENFSNEVVNYCNSNKKLKTSVIELYNLIEYKQIKSTMPTESPNKDSSKNCCCSSGYCYSEFMLPEIEVISREEIGNKLLLEWKYTDNNIQSSNINKPQIESKIREAIQYGKHREEPEALNATLLSKKMIEISSETYNIQCVDTKFPYFLKGDILCKFGEYDLTRVNPIDAYKLIKHEQIPFKLTFKSKHCSCISYMKKRCNHCMYCSQNKVQNCCKSKNAYSKNRQPDQSNKCATFFEKCTNVCKRKPKVANNSEGGGCIGIVVKWMIKFLILSSGIISKSTSILDAVTDIILLYKASTNN
eukprot:500979_1